jgi:transposase
MDILKQNVGIDVAKDSFVATLTVLLKDQILKHLRTRKFQNNKRGFNEMVQWL